MCFLDLGGTWGSIGVVGVLVSVGVKGGSAGVWVAFELGCMMVSVCSPPAFYFSLCRSALP